MKKKSLSRILALGLTAVMTAGMLAGCGGDGGSESTEASGGGHQRSLPRKSLLLRSLLSRSLLSRSHPRRRLRSLLRQRAARRQRAAAAKCPRWSTGR